MKGQQHEPKLSLPPPRRKEEEGEPAAPGEDRNGLGCALSFEHTASSQIPTASAINSLQFLCAIAGKLLSGALLACETPATQRAISLTLFVVAPLAYCLSHLLLLDVHPAALLAADLTNGLTFAQSNARLMCYAITVGLPFGALFGTLLCLPARLFGRRDLPTLQSAIYAAILLASGLFIPLAGYLRDTYGGYQLPLLLTAGASAIEMCLLAHLMRVDARARASAATSYQEVL